MQLFAAMPLTFSGEMAWHQRAVMQCKGFDRMEAGVAYQSENFFCGEELIVGQQVDTLLWHAVKAPQIAALSQRYPEI